MKHKDNPISPLQDRFFAKKEAAFTDISFEFFVYFCLTAQKPCCFIVNRETIERLCVVFQEEVGGLVGLVLKTDKEDELASNFYNNIGKLSLQALSTHKKPNICFVEDVLFDQPLLYNKNIKKLKLTKDSCFEEVVSWLEKNGFSPGLNGHLSYGDFFINGGVVDVRPFNDNRIIRLSFLDDLCDIFIVNHKTNIIISATKNVDLYPAVYEKELSPRDFFGGGWKIGSFQKNTLTNKKNKLMDKKIKLETIDYHLFKKKFFKKKYFQIFANVERGFVFKGVCFIPDWFINSGGTFIESPKTQILNGVSFLSIGSLYVHEDFGVCRFLGLEVVGNKERICLRFEDGVVRIGVQYILKLSFYSNKIDGPLDFLNRPGRWKKQKDKAQKEAEKYVTSLIKTYSKRELLLSKPWVVDGELISSFVDNFEHKDTPDQARCWNEIKKDFCEKSPMNRLVCGDVGFGKTEIAIRASFLATINNKQTVVLAPTTILTSQLYQSFIKRLGPFGVNVGFLSSLSNNKSLVIDSFLSKKIDVLIGTSSLLFQKDILARCGLFIVDEEHRFGVKDKELVFLFNPYVHFLSLSATPIPRSLQFSLNNVRSISLIQTPPIERRPIICFSSSFNIEVVVGAILKELNRGGQVFFVDNSVDSLKKILLSLKRRLPFVSFGLIYSRLKKTTLTKTMTDFIGGKTQVLLSTTIIESGIDIGLANTIVINNAHLFGLAQLYQLRGRVGRSHSQAFAWFLSPYKEQTPEGRKRLKTIIKHTSLGSGYNIALSDLNIRGAGSLFGYSQSGGGGVGFEFYTKLIDLTINKKKPDVCFVDIFQFSLSGALSDQGQCSYFYNCVFSAKSIKELVQIRQDFIAVFGSCFKDFNLLLQTKELSLVASKKNILKITKKEDFIFLSFNIRKKRGNIDALIGFINTFFNKKGVSYWFVKSKINFTFKYQSVNENDYILLLSFIKKLPY